MKTNGLPASDPLDLIAERKIPGYGIDLYDRIVYWNEGAARVLGWTADEVLGRACFDALEGRDADGNLYCTRDSPIVVAAMKGEAVQPYVVEVLRKGVGPVKTVVRAVPLPSPGPGFAVLIHFFETEGSAVEKLVTALCASQREATIPLPPDPPISASPLSPREREIVLLLSNGFTALNIAAKLNLSHPTARNHIQNILRKLNVHSQIQAVALSFRRGWL